jgi:hypothetical protein
MFSPFSIFIEVAWETATAIESAPAHVPALPPPGCHSPKSSGPQHAAPAIAHFEIT